jgi:hypothetical protein
MTSSTRSSARARASFPTRRALARGASLLIAAAFLALEADAQSRSVSMTGSNYAVDVDPGPVVIASLNPDVDSFPDIAVGCEASQSVVIYWGLGDGTFDPVPTKLDNLVPPRSLKAAEVGGTGLPDLLVGCESPGGLTLHLGSGLSSFAPPKSAASNPSAWVDDSAVSPQQDADSFLSLDAIQARMERWNRTGNTYSQEVLHPVAAGAITAAAADLDADARVDLLVLHQNSAQLWVLHNQGDWTTTSFAHSQTLLVGTGPSDLLVGQLDGDPRLDVVVADPGTSTVRVYANTDPFGYETEDVYTIPTSSPWDLALEDMDLDGDVDVLVTDVGSLPGRVVLLENVGGGAFAAPVTLASVGAWPRRMASGDLNGDGRPDLVTANMFSNSITVLLNATQPPPGTGSIAGRVFMGEGAGSAGQSVDLRNVEVWTNPSPSGTPALSREDGSFVLGELPPGDYTVYAKLDYVDPGTGQPHSVIAQTAGSFQVTSGATVSKVDLRYPWPVVAQGGWDGLLGGGGAASQWDTLVEYFTRDPGDPDKASKQIPAFLVFAVPDRLADPAAGYDPSAFVVGQHTENADRLASWIQNQVRGELGRFVAVGDLQRVKHSFVCADTGALVTRALIVSERLGAGGIGRVVSLDGLHGGSQLADLVPFRAGLRELFLNGAAAPAPGEQGADPVGWNAANADVGPKARKRWLLFACTPDGFVDPDFSACGQGRVWQVPTCTCAYGIPNPDSCLTVPQCYWKATWVEGTSATVTIPDCHEAILGDAERLEQSAIFLDRGVAEIEAALSLGCPPESAEAPSTLSGAAFTTASLTVTAAGSQTYTVPVDVNALVHVRVLVAGAGATVTMTDPNGLPVAKANGSVTGEGGLLTIEEFDVLSPAPGDYDFTLDGGASDAMAEVRVDFENERVLSVSCSPTHPTLAQPVQITARCVDDAGALVVPAAGVVTATVHSPVVGVPSATIDLLDDGLSGDGAAGDGVFGGVVPGTVVALDGRYSVTLAGALSTAAGETVRGASAAFTVAPTSGVLQALSSEDLVDQDANGKAEALELSIDVSLASDRWLSVQADLVDGSGEIISRLSQTIPRGVGPGSETVVLVVPSEEIVTHGVDGPWTLTRIQLVDQDAGALPCSWLPDKPTAAHALSDFEGLPAPQVGHLAPSSGHALGGTVVYVHGSGLETTTDVQVAGTSAQFEVLTDELLKVTTPKFVLGASGGLGNLPDARAGVAVDVVVTTPWGTYTAPDAFTYKYRGVAPPN